MLAEVLGSCSLFSMILPHVSVHYPLWAQAWLAFYSFPPKKYELPPEALVYQGISTYVGPTGMFNAKGYGMICPSYHRFGQSLPNLGHLRRTEQPMPTWLPPGWCWEWRDKLCLGIGEVSPKKVINSLLKFIGTAMKDWRVCESWVNMMQASSTYSCGAQRSLHLKIMGFQWISGWWILEPLSTCFRNVVDSSNGFIDGGVHGFTWF